MCQVQRFCCGIWSLDEAETTRSGKHELTSIFGDIPKYLPRRNKVYHKGGRIEAFRKPPKLLIFFRNEFAFLQFYSFMLFSTDFRKRSSLIG